MVSSEGVAKRRWPILSSRTSRAGIIRTVDIARYSFLGQTYLSIMSSRLVELEQVPMITCLAVAGAVIGSKEPSPRESFWLYERCFNRSLKWPLDQ